MEIVLVIETSDVGAKYTADAIISMGFEPVFIYQEGNYQGDTLKQLKNCHSYLCKNTTSSEAIESIITKNNIDNIFAVITLLDSRLPIACELANKLGVKGPDQSILTLTDKGAVARLIPEYSPNFLVFNSTRLPSDDELQHLADSFEKVVLKSTRSAGAYGMAILSKKNLYSAITSHIDDCRDSKMRNGDWIIQPMLPGKLFSLEGFVFNGNVNLLGYSSRGKIGNTESACFFPADNELSSRVLAQSQAALRTLVSKANFKNGYFHTEFIVEADQCALIDANFGRIGGGGLAQQIALSFMKSPQDVFKHIIAITLMSNDDSYRNWISAFYAVQIAELVLSVNYGVKDKAIMKNLVIPEGVVHTQLLDLNKEVPAMGENNWAWIGILVGTVHQVLAILPELKIIDQDDNICPPYFLLESEYAMLKAKYSTQRVIGSSIEPPTPKKDSEEDNDRAKYSSYRPQLFTL
ncbi:MAG: ATP-grasp domain-containing protein [Legionellales bacterium]|nr:ATP-grasp domain-containing protein [Legionellales bacterium]